jgi:aspartyl-tRNA(Asn)/glutamyl-tRNA(Gln) amidotransferase subunit A
MSDRDRPLWSLPAHELGSAYAQGLSPIDVIQATLLRVHEVNPRLNAIVTLDETGALRAAEMSALRWKDARPISLLDGVPFTVKDNILVAGMRATWGSRLYRDFVPEQDEVPVQRLREAGAIILGKTNVPEFTVHGFTDNALFGVTRNPWDPELTPGGSSGGAVASVASGMGAFALGTDGGGSIRRPAAHTGLVGFKPSREMVPRGRGFPAILHNFEVIGPIARCVDDVIVVMEVISGEAWARSKSLAAPSRLRIAYAPTFGDAPVDPVVRRAVDETVERARSLGFDVETVAPFDLADPLSEIWPVISQTGIAWLLDQHVGWEHKVAPAIAEMAAVGRHFTARDYVAALDAVASMGQAFERFFDCFDFLITPAAAAMPWPAGESHPKTIGGKAVGPRGHAVFTPLANALGIPALSLPCRVEGDALPIGLQIMAARNRDWLLLKFARDHENQLFLHQWPRSLT